MAKSKKQRKILPRLTVDKEGRTVLFPNIARRRKEKNERRAKAGLSPLEQNPFARQRQLNRENRQKTKKAGKENGHDVTEARGSGAARPQKFRKNG
jgi:hypothetical protein